MDTPHRDHLSFHRATPRGWHADSSSSPVLLLHGFTSAKETWKNVIGKIADATGRTVYSIDARNHGDSFWNEAFDYDVMVSDLASFLKQLDTPRAVLIGHSMGGKTASFFTLQNPGIVEKLIVEDISPARLPPNDRRYPYLYIQLLNQVLQEIPPDVKSLDSAKRFVASYLLEKTPQEHRGERHGTFDSTTLPLKQMSGGEFRWKTNLEVLEESILHGFRYSPKLEGTFEKPVLFLYGTKSPYNVLNDKDFILKLFPKTTFLAFEGAGHQLHLEFPEEFLEAVIKFLNEN